MPLFATQSAYLNSQEGMDLYADTLDSCLPREVGPTPLFCDPLTFILSVEFFGQVYRECTQFHKLLLSLLNFGSL